MWSRPSGVVLTVIGANDVARTGAAVLLRQDPSVMEVIGLLPDEALHFRHWSEIDAVFLDAVDPTRPVDQVVGASLVEHIRAATSCARPRIVAVCDDASWRPVRRRMAEAGADLVTTRRSVADRTALRASVLCRGDDHDPRRDHTDEAEHRLGITPWSRVNLGVAAAFAEQLVPEAGWVGPRGRERLARRLRFNRAARLQPMGADGRLPDREQDVPSLLQIQRFVTWATHVEPHVQPREVATAGRSDGNRSAVAARNVRGVGR